MVTTPIPTPVEVALTQVNQRFGLADVQLGDEQSIAADLVAQQYDLAPRCEDRRVQLGDRRKAFNLNICEYKPDAATLNSASIERVVTYFLDEILVRIDIDTAGDLPALESALSKIEAKWPSGNKRPLKSTDRTETVWLSGTDELSLSHLSTAAIVEYRIRDTRLADKLPWLFE